MFAGSCPDLTHLPFTNQSSQQGKLEKKISLVACPRRLECRTKPSTLKHHNAATYIECSTEKNFGGNLVLLNERLFCTVD